MLVSAVCGYAHYIAEADSGLVLDEPFEQAQLTEYLGRMLGDADARAAWSRNGLAFAETADTINVHVETEGSFLRVEVDDDVFLASVSIQGANEAITQIAEHFGVDPHLEK